MKINVNHAALLEHWLRPLQSKAFAVSVGRLDVDFTAEELARAAQQINDPSTAADHRLLSADEFLARLGFSGLAERHSIAGHGSADAIFDISAPLLPDELRGAFSLVIDPLGLDGVLDVQTALANLHAMVAPGGAVLHFTPCNNFVNIGYYQFSPRLIFERCAAAGLDVVQSALISYNPRRHGGLRWEVRPASPAECETAAPGQFDDRAVLHATLALRPPAANAQHVRTRGPRWFSPYEISFGSRIDRPQRRIRPLRNFQHTDGNCWSAHAPEFAGWCDTLDQNARSPAVLIEDGVAIGPPHTMHETIKKTGGGAYSHWGDYLLLSTSDNSDPNTNGREYFLIIPASFDI